MSPPNSTGFRERELSVVQRATPFRNETVMKESSHRLDRIVNLHDSLSFEMTISKFVVGVCAGRSRLVDSAYGSAP